MRLIYILQEILITLPQVSLKKVHYFNAKLLKLLRPSSSKHQCLWLCFTRQQTKAKNPDYFGRPAKAGFGEKLKKSYPVCPLQRTGDHKQHSSSSTMTTPDALWEVEQSCCRDSIFHHCNTGDESSHDGSPSDRCCVGSTRVTVLFYSHKSTALVYTRHITSLIIIGTIPQKSLKFRHNF